MNFLERVKRDLEDRHGNRDKVLVGHKALRELVDHFAGETEYLSLTDFRNWKMG